MTSTHAPTVQLTVTRTKRPAVWPAFALAVASAGAYVVFFALPYYVNDLGRFPLAEVAYGMPDPMTQWPHAGGGIVSAIFGLGALATLACAPFGAAIAIGWAALNLWRERLARDVGRIAMSLLAVAFGVGAFVWLASPLGSALITRFLD